MSSLIDTINRKNTDATYLAKYEKFLSHIEADIHEKTAVKIAISMRKQNSTFQLEWWKLFTDSVKIRIISYASNFPFEKQAWFLPLKEFYPYEGKYLSSK